MDWSKGDSFHRLYGHGKFLWEALKAGKNDIFIWNVCTNNGCDRRPRLRKKV